MDDVERVLAVGCDVIVKLFPYCTVFDYKSNERYGFKFPTEA